MVLVYNRTIMKLTTKELILALVAVLILLGGAWFYVANHSGIGGAVYAPAGRVIPGFPAGLLIDSSAHFTESYTMGSGSNAEYVAEWNSSATPQSLFAGYALSLAAAGWQLKNQSSSASFATIYAASSTGAVNFTASEEYPGAPTAVSLAYVPGDFVPTSPAAAPNIAYGGQQPAVPAAASADLARLLGSAKVEFPAIVSATGSDVAAQGAEIAPFLDSSAVYYEHDSLVYADGSNGGRFTYLLKGVDVSSLIAHFSAIAQQYGWTVLDSSSASDAGILEAEATIEAMHNRLRMTYEVIPEGVLVGVQYQTTIK